jgi:predicted nucleic acid-binding protein
MAARTRRIVERQFAFWDASALVPLCVGQSTTNRAAIFYKKYEAVIWWATPLEISSALARLLRMKQVDPQDWLKCRQLATDLIDSCFVIQPSDVLLSQAMQLVETYDLRAADALQLSAALQWSEGAPQARIFLTSDQRLRDAAALRGFEARLL